MRIYACLLITLLAAPLLAQATVSSIFKPEVTGKIRKLDVQGRLEIEVKGTDVPERIGLDEVEQISFGNKGDERKPEDTPLRVYLTNGDVLYGLPENGPEKEDDRFILKNPRFGDLLIAVEMIKRIEIVSNVQPNVLPELDKGVVHDVTYFAAEGGKPAQMDPSSELVRIVKEGAYLYNEILDEDAVGGVLYSWSRLRGVVCYRGKVEPFEKLLGIFTLRDGSLLRGPITAWTDGKITVDHRVLKKTLTLDESSLLSVTMKNGRYQYLSDMDFAKTPEERPYYLPGNFNYADYLFKARRDQAQGGGALSLRGRVYPKGLGVHAISRLTYDVNRSYKRFIADVGVDDSAGDLASVEFKVYADGKLVWESGVLRRSTAAKSIDLEILNVTQIVLEVTAADNADIQDRANWANAKLVR